MSIFYDLFLCCCCYSCVIRSAPQSSSLCECRKISFIKIYIILYIFVIFHTHTFFMLLEKHEHELKKKKKVLTYTRTHSLLSHTNTTTLFFFFGGSKQIREIFSPTRNYEKTFICNLSADWIGNRLYGTRLIIIIIFNYTRSSFVCDETLKSLLSPYIYSVGEKKQCVYIILTTSLQIRFEGWFQAPINWDHLFSSFACAHYDN